MRSQLDDRISKALLAWTAHYDRAINTQEFQTLKAVLVNEVEAWNRELVVKLLERLRKHRENAADGIKLHYSELIQDLETLDPQSIIRRIESEPGLQ